MGKTGTAPGTTTLTLPGGRAISLADWIDAWQWTTIELQTGDNDTLNAFTAGRSQPITGGTRNMTLVDTNIESTGLNGHPKAWEFMVYSFWVEFTRVCRANVGETNPRLTSYSDPLILRTFFELNRRLFCRYVYNGKKYIEGLPVDFPTGHGASIFTTNVTTEQVNNGVPSPRDRVALVLPVNEEELLGYEMEVTPVIALVINQGASDGGVALTFTDMRIGKSGLIKRRVN
jgi:hypothetical protein